MSAAEEKQSPTSSLFRTGLKLGGCGALIVAIAFGFAVFTTDGTVSESHADIAWLSPFERSNTETFQDSLQRLGHHDPSRYDLNGNTLFFSTQSSRKPPREVMVEYQEEFRRQGLNDRIYTSIRPEEADARHFTGLTGGLVPLAISDTQVILGGVVTRNRASNTSELLDNAAGIEDPEDLFRAHRYIEITRGSDSRHTSIVASWSDEAFNYHRMVPGSPAAGQSFDPEVPPCPGCTRLTRFADDNPSTGERADLAFIGPRSVPDTRAFYEDALSRRGWAPGEFSAALDDVEEHFHIPLPTAEALVLYRDDREITLAFLPDFETGETITFATYNQR